MVGGRATLLADLLASGLLPIIASIGMLPDGTPVNVNADDAAAGVAAALDALDTADPDAEFTAACRHAQRRRLGPWRRDDRAARRDRDLAAMARAGFGYRMASRVVDAPDIETLEDEAAERAAARES